MAYDTRTKGLLAAIRSRILCLDGAMGTALQARNLTEADFGGAELDGCNENLILTRPDVISAIHRDYLEAGADIIETNTFGATPLVLDEYDLSAKHYEINKLGAELARAECDRLSTPERTRYVAGSIGPTTKAISVTGGVTFAELIQNFYEQAKGLHAGGADYFLLETCQDTRNIKAGLIGIGQFLKEVDRQIPVAISGTIEPMGTMLAGQGVDALFASVSHVELLYLGLNCATGPEFMTDHIRTLAELSRFPVACVPNAGLPDEDGIYLETPEMMGDVLTRFASQGWINVVGGCCGTTSKHIAHFAKLAETMQVRNPAKRQASIVSGIEFLEITDEMRPVIVGERTNVIGSRKFKRLIVDGKVEEASEIARAQVKAGAQIVDVCLANPDRDEMVDMEEFLSHVINKVKVPLMIDSTDEKVIELALSYCQGKALINSINLEDGLERFDAVVPLARRFGAALVVGTIDEDPESGMGVTRARKLEIAERSYQILTEDYGVDPTDIYWDPLVFPCATGDENYIGSAAETIEGIRLIKQRFPETKTILGVSNVSFGLPNAGREVLNSVFLYHCVQAGLDLAIVNSEKLERYGSLPADEVELADNLLFNRGEDPIGKFAAKYRDAKPRAKVAKEDLPIDERLAGCILEGSKEGLVEDLDTKLAEGNRPLDIINGPLMAGMDEVGRLFNANKLIVAEVLQSAEAMKAAVGHLEQFMEKDEDASRGTVLLATVKGDVHDIGKNLVDIILSNNGFKVINLGIKIPPEQLIAATKKHNPDIIGLSGLLVKSAQMMLVTAEDFTRAGIDVPMLVGGAALSEKFVMTRIDPLYKGRALYAQDAMNGLDLAKKIMDPTSFAKLMTELDERRDTRYGGDEKKEEAPAPVPAVRSTTIRVLENPPAPPDFDRHVVRGRPIDHIWNWINPRMLYGRHLGLKGAPLRLLDAALSDPAALKTLKADEPAAYKIYEAVQELKDEYRGSEIMSSAAVYRFFRAASEGNDLHLFTPEGGDTPVATFTFPRQNRPDGVCLADLVNPVGGPPDSLGMFCTTIGTGVRALADKLNAKGDYLKSHILFSLAIESAEGFAELLHKDMRRMWGIQEPVDQTRLDVFKAKYQGKRYSFGYPACPALEDQATLWKLLNPNEIGVELTEEFMMDPEASVSAVAFHHPDATYFNTGIRDDG